MRNWLFLSKNGEDEYINMLARSVGAEPLDTDMFDYYYDVTVDGRTPILRGILKYKIMHQCLKDQRDFFYVDSGYFGNHFGAGNRRGDKFYHRIVKNDLQSNQIQDRPADRWERLQIHLLPRRTGGRIILAAPDEKPCRYYGINRDEWLRSTLDTLRLHTDREIVIRERAPKRQDRVATDPLSRVLLDDVHCLVTFNSIAGVEAILHGVPAIVLSPTHAAQPVASTRLQDIENPLWPDEDLRRAWVHSLAYQQYHVRELQNGTAMRMIDQ